MSQGVSAAFDSLAEAYATSAVHASGADLARLPLALGADSGWSVLDIGTGAGHAAIAVAPHVRAVTAVDPARRMLETAERLAGERGFDNIHFVHATAEKMPFAAATFDGAFSRYSAHHWPDAPAGLAEVRRVLKLGSPFVLIDTVGFDAAGLDTFLNTLELLRDTSHIRNVTTGAWERLFAEAGFASDRVERWDIEIETEGWLKRSATEPWRATACRNLLSTADQGAKSAMSIARDGSTFTLPVALIKAHGR